MKYYKPKYRPRKYTIYIARVSFKPLLRKTDQRPIRINGWKNTKQFLNKLNNRGIKSYAKRYSNKKY